MGCKSAAMMCQRATSAVSAFMRSKDILVCSYLDDFAGCSPVGCALEDFLMLGDVLVSLGLTEAKHKSFKPSTTMEFLGVLFNTETLTLEITPSRVSELLGILSDWSSKRSASKREMQGLVGKLQFVAKCIPSGRLFICRLLDGLSGLKLQTHRRRLTVEFHKDLSWWLKCIEHFNGVSMMLEQEWRVPDALFSTDACLTGGGGWCEGEYFRFEFTESIISMEWHINILELLVLLVSVRLWGTRLVGKKFKVFCDNLATVQVLNTGRCKDKVMLKMLREIAYFCSTTGCQVKAEHLPGVENRLADSLSRWKDKTDSERSIIDTKLTGWIRREITVDLYTTSDLW